MSVNASWLRMFMEMKKRFGFQGDVLTWGVQDVHLSHEEGTTLGLPVVIPETERKWMLSKNQQQWTSDPRRYMATKDLFRMLGFDSLQTLDAFPQEGPDIICDLNIRLPDELAQKFDLLIDIGVLEHTANGFQALENAARLLKTNGWLCAYTPLISPIQTCMFHPNPPFYYDILSANGFDSIVSYVNWMPVGDQHSDIKTIWLEYKYNDHLEICRDQFYVVLMVVARKRQHVDVFKTVLQNYYHVWHENEGLPQWTAPKERECLCL